jgi:hypothetical protein
MGFDIEKKFCGPESILSAAASAMSASPPPLLKPFGFDGFDGGRLARGLVFFVAMVVPPDLMPP